jgi:hypothetical protein
MPTAHRNALKRLLSHIELRISETEARLLDSTNDDQRVKLVEEIADLHGRQKEISDTLMCDGDS